MHNRFKQVSMLRTVGAGFLTVGKEVISMERRKAGMGSVVLG